MTSVLDWIDAHTPQDPRIQRLFDKILPALVLAVLVLGIISLGRVSDIATKNKSNLQAQESERTERIYATNALDEYLCGQIEAVKGALEGILNKVLAIPPRLDATPEQLEVRHLIAQRLLRLEGGGACVVRIPSPPR